MIELSATPITFLESEKGELFTTAVKAGTNNVGLKSKVLQPSYRHGIQGERYISVRRSMMWPQRLRFPASTYTPGAMPGALLS